MAPSNDSLVVIPDVAEEATIEATYQQMSLSESSVHHVAAPHSAQLEMLERLLQLDLEQAIVWHMWDNNENELEKSPVTYFVGTAGTAAGVASVGYVVWALRGGALVTAVTSSLPTWKVVDPAALLTAYRASATGPADAVEKMLSGNSGSARGSRRRAASSLLTTVLCAIRALSRPISPRIAASAQRKTRIGCGTPSPQHRILWSQRKTLAIYGKITGQAVLKSLSVGSRRTCSRRRSRWKPDASARDYCGASWLLPCANRG